MRPPAVAEVVAAAVGEAFAAAAAVAVGEAFAAAVAAVVVAAALLLLAAVAAAAAAAWASWPLPLFLLETYKAEPSSVAEGALGGTAAAAAAAVAAGAVGAVGALPLPLLTYMAEPSSSALKDALRTLLPRFACACCVGAGLLAKRLCVPPPGAAIVAFVLLGTLARLSVMTPAFGVFFDLNCTSIDVSVPTCSWPSAMLASPINESESVFLFITCTTNECCPL